VSRRFAVSMPAALDSLAGLALVHELGGQRAQADAQLAQARELARWRDDADDLALVESCAARVALLRGDADAALRWLQGMREPSDLRAAISRTEVPAITECRVLAASGGGAELREASARLAQLRQQARALHLTCQEIEIAALEVLALVRRGETGDALRALAESLALASPGGWVRPFVELGPPLADLLDALPEAERDRSLVRRIRAARHRGARESRAPAGESLTNRERDVLELLAQRLRDKEIAQKLGVSPETVKTHLKGLYQKLGCSDRRGAVARARELALLG
jgi:LuxR family maltose regulon positive regulatory protein